MSRAPFYAAPRARLQAVAALALALALVGAAMPATAAEEAITVHVDRAKVMHISRPADIVIIGNPAIADATIQDNQTLIITGRSFGTTNLIILDSAGKSIANEIINVGSADDDVVTVFRRAKRETLSCTPECAPTLAVGDEPQIFNTVKGQVQDHNSISDSAAKN